MSEHNTLMTKTSSSFQSRSKYQRGNRRSSSFAPGCTDVYKCCFPDCQENATAVHCLCEFHRNKIADDFQSYYLLAGNLVENLARAGISRLSDIKVEDTFIGDCDRFLNDSISRWFDLENFTRRRRLKRGPKRSRKRAATVTPASPERR
jgi:hypothetical protein